MSATLGGECELPVSAALRIARAGRSPGTIDRTTCSGRGHARPRRDVFVDVRTLGEAGDLVHELIGERPALGVVVVRQRMIGVRRTGPLPRRPETDEGGP